MMPAASPPPALTGQLLIGALREHDAAMQAGELARRAQHVSDVIRSLSGTLDEGAIRDTLRRLRLPRNGSWALVELVEADGSIRRLPGEHPAPIMRPAAERLGGVWPAPGESLNEAVAVILPVDRSGLLGALRNVQSLAAINAIGFGSLLVVPLRINGAHCGAMIFVSPAGQAPFAGDEIDLAREMVAYGEMALGNARLYASATALGRAADAANQAKSAFLATMSHELRTPLNAIGGYVELMELELCGPVTSEQRTSFGRIKANQQHLLTLITEVLDYARLEEGHLTYRCERVSLNLIRGEVVAMLSVVAAAKHLVLDMPVAEDVYAWADANRVRQIMVNLVTNAIKYSVEEGGRVTISCVREGTRASVRVADNGPGIPPDEHERVFHPFVQLPTGLRDRLGGVGLGLAISRELAVGMGGDLALSSSSASGCVFTLTLPGIDAAA